MILFEPHEKFRAAIIRYEDDRAVYSYEKLIDVLMKNDSMSYAESAEWISYNMQNIGFSDWPIIEDDDPTEEDSE